MKVECFIYYYLRAFGTVCLGDLYDVCAEAGIGRARAFRAMDRLYQKGVLDYDHGRVVRKATT